MEITTGQLLAEAGQMALELRLKDRAIAALEAEVAALRSQAATGADAAPADGAPE